MTDKKYDDIDAYLDSIPGMPPAPKQQASSQHQQPGMPPTGDGVMDVTQMLMQKLMQQHGPIMPQPMGPPPNVDMMPQQPERRSVYLREGVTYYKRIPADMSDLPIAMKAGPATNVNGKEFLVKSVIQCYLVENHQAIDLSNIDHSKLQTMLAIEAPWTGVILVPESAVVNASKNNGPQVLKG